MRKYKLNTKIFIPFLLLIPIACIAGSSLTQDSRIFGSGTISITNKGGDITIGTSSGSGAVGISNISTVLGNTGYLMSTFLYGTDGNSHLAILSSPDANTWSFATSYNTFSGHGGGTLRDPSIAIKNGIYYAAYTWNAFTDCPAFYIATSTNLQNWTDTTNVDCSSVLSGTSRHAYAPEFFTDTDGSQHILVACASGTANFQIYMLDDISSSKNWSSFSTPYLLTGSAITNNSGVIDPCMINNSGTYELFYANTIGNIYVASSTTRNAGFNNGINVGAAASVLNFVEGPSVIQTGDNQWTIFMFSDGNGVANYSTTTSNFSTFSTGQLLKSTIAANHGSVISVSDLKTFKDVMFGTPQQPMIFQGGANNGYIFNSGSFYGNYLSIPGYISVIPPNGEVASIALSGTGGGTGQIMTDPYLKGTTFYISRYPQGGYDYVQFTGGGNNTHWFGNMTLDGTSTFTSTTPLLKGGSNLYSGTFVMNAGSGTAPTTAITGSCAVFCSRIGTNGTATAPLATIVSGSGVIFTGAATDSGTYSWGAIGVNR